LKQQNAPITNGAHTNDDNSAAFDIMPSTAAADNIRENISSRVPDGEERAE
jgi:hypothetical protein